MEQNQSLYSMEARSVSSEMNGVRQTAGLSVHLHFYILAGFLFIYQVIILILVV